MVVVVVVGVRGGNGQAWEWWQCLCVDGSDMEWIGGGGGGSTWWSGRRVCHGVDRGRVG